LRSGGVEGLRGSREKLEAETLKAEMGKSEEIRKA
jgi:hypothetical protein